MLHWGLHPAQQVEVLVPAASERIVAVGLWQHKINKHRSQYGQTLIYVWHCLGYYANPPYLRQPWSGASPKTVRCPFMSITLSPTILMRKSSSRGTPAKWAKQEQHKAVFFALVLDQRLHGVDQAQCDIIYVHQRSHGVVEGITHVCAIRALFPKNQRQGSVRPTMIHQESLAQPGL